MMMMMNKRRKIFRYYFCFFFMNENIEEDGIKNKKFRNLNKMKLN